jgi:tRNA G37 N-methylase Trm5
MSANKDRARLDLIGQVAVINLVRSEHLNAFDEAIHAALAHTSAYREAVLRFSSRTRLEGN